MGLMPSHRGGEHAAWALKAICIFPDNPKRGLDAHQGGVALFDGETGELLALLNASAVTEIRTAAVSAVATRALAREDARVLRDPRRRRAGAARTSRRCAPAATFDEIRIWSRDARERARRSPDADRRDSRSARSRGGARRRRRRRHGDDGPRADRAARVARAAART